VDLRRTPLLGVLPEARPATVGVDVEATRELASDTVEEALGVGLLSEVLGLLWRARPLRTTIEDRRGH
jgi:hypothetical protein